MSATTVRHLNQQTLIRELASGGKKSHSAYLHLEGRKKEKFPKRPVQESVVMSKAHVESLNGTYTSGMILLRADLILGDLDNEGNLVGIELLGRPSIVTLSPNTLAPILSNEETLPATKKQTSKRVAANTKGTKGNSAKVVGSKAKSAKANTNKSRTARAGNRLKGAK